ncbi:hypothetical protein JNUCC1_02827 [Lentibacillus sp. JNUCC-1]|uniref:hypothetical protein n=1 Tax=Lentibacillus sp. JNUCC-1 TaxID=2654513 RepID=UPI0012E8A355|nr:hypothetical protein [Lentibacillus sp. JNUCC-1]MUV38955.1 hypothetical protein [Lentibacillus sp. JNUCC-1]
MRSIKLMLLGIAFMLISIYIPHEPGFRTAGFELYVLVFGSVLTLIGFFAKEKKR